MPTDLEWEREERAKQLRAQTEARALESGSFICPWCQRYVDPAEWWTHIDANPYEDEDSFGPTLFHRRCGARVPDKKKWWVTALRERYNRSPIKPGDYVRPKKRLSRHAGPQQVFRVVGIETDEYAGITEDDPYYLLDSGDTDPVHVGYALRRKDLELVGRPYLESKESE
jgi:hypothetical protein